MGVESFVRSTSEPAPVRLGPVTVDAWVEASDRGGQDTPQKRVEDGYTTTRNGADPVRVSFRAWVERPTLKLLRSLRDRQEMLTASIGPYPLPQAALEDLQTSAPGEHPGAYRIDATIKEIQQAATGTATVTLETASGTQTVGPGAPLGVGFTQYGVNDTPQPIQSGPTQVTTNQRDSEEFSRTLRGR